MTRWYYVAYFFGGAFLCNAVPHFVSGVTGHPFQSPFAHPPGEGLSSATVNVLWGFFNAVVGYVLRHRFGVSAAHRHGLQAQRYKRQVLHTASPSPHGVQ
jgi:hypothetical protein